jgi:hypothetical protein
MSEIEERPCPFCGGTDFVVGMQRGQAAVYDAAKSMSFSGAELHLVFCTNCGSVVRTYTPDVVRIRGWRKRND